MFQLQFICIALIGLAIVGSERSSPDVIYSDSVDISRRQEENAPGASYNFRLGGVVATPFYPTAAQFQSNFESFENRMKNFISNVRRGLQSKTMSYSNGLLEEIDQYMSKLPSQMKLSKMVTTESRDTCHCGGAIVSPCPLQCINSCYAYVRFYGNKAQWTNMENCSSITSIGSNVMEDCRCFNGSDINCREGIEYCFNSTTEYTEDIPCSHFYVEKSTLVSSFDLVLNFLIEPLKMHLRRVEYSLASLKESAFNIDYMYSISAQMCKKPTDPNCTSDVDHLLSVEKDKYNQMKRNLTLKLLGTKSQIDAVSRNVDELREVTFARINQNIKDYFCCLQTLNLTSMIYDCHDVKTAEMMSPAEESDIICPRDVSFLCNNRKCVPRHLICNYFDDCGDNSDETTICEPKMQWGPVHSANSSVSDHL